MEWLGRELRGIQGRNRREETTKETKDTKTTDANKKHLKFGRSYSGGAPQPSIRSLISRI